MSHFFFEGKSMQSMKTVIAYVALLTGLSMAQRYVVHSPVNTQLMGPVDYGKSSASSAETHRGKAAVLGRSVQNGLEDLVVQYAGFRYESQGTFSSSSSSVTTQYYEGDLLLVKDGKEAGKIEYPEIKYWARIFPTPISYPAEYTDNDLFGIGVVTLRPVNGVGVAGSNACGVIAVSSTLSMYVYEVCWTGSAFATAQLKKVALPEDVVRSSGIYRNWDFQRPLAVIDNSVAGQYLVALGNPQYGKGTGKEQGRVDLYLIDGTKGWSVTRKNNLGFTSGIPATIMEDFSDNTEFGMAVAGLGDVDGDGVQDLAVLSPGKIFVMFLNADYTLREYNVIGGSGMPWRETPESINYTGYDLVYGQACHGLSAFDLDNNGKKELITSCSVRQQNVVINNLSNMVNDAIIRSLSLDSKGAVVQASLLGKFDVVNTIGYSDPLLIYDRDHGKPSLLIATCNVGYMNGCGEYFNTTALIHDVDLVKNYTIVAGNPRDSVVNLDSLFYKSGVSGYEFKVLGGHANCEVSGSGKGMACVAGDVAVNTWTAIEVSAKGSCDAYRPCKTKDTLYVFARDKSSANPNIASRLPKQIVLPSNFPRKNWGNLRSLAYLADYSNRNVTSSVKWIGLRSSAQGSVLQPSSSQLNEFSFTAVPDAVGNDTLVFTLSHNSTSVTQDVAVRVVPPQNLLLGKIPATPGLDTAYGALGDVYFELPVSSGAGTLYDYSVPQAFNGHVELIGNYLHVLVPEEEDVTLSYRDGAVLKSRKITFTIKESATSAIVNPSLSSIKVRVVPQGVLIEGRATDYSMHAYDLNGNLLQQAKGTVQGSTVIELNHPGVQFVVVKTDKEVRQFKVFH